MYKCLSSEGGQLKYSRVAPKSNGVLNKGGTNDAVSVEHFCSKIICMHFFKVQSKSTGVVNKGGTKVEINAKIYENLCTSTESR